MFKTILLVIVVALCVAMPAGAQTWDLTTDSAAVITPTSVPASHGQWRHGAAYDLDAGWAFSLANRGDYGPGDGLARWGLQISLDGDPDMNECPLQVYNTNNTGPTYGLFEPHKFYIHGGVLSTSTRSNPVNHPRYTVFRWVAPADGLYSVSTLITPCAGQPALINCQVLVNGVSVFGRDALGNDVNYSGSMGPLAYDGIVSLAANDTVDLALGPGVYYGQWTTIEKFRVMRVVSWIEGVVTANMPGHPVVPGVTITATNDPWTTTTDANGHYFIPVQAGSHDVEASSPVLKTKLVTGVQTTVDQGTTLDFDLDPRDVVSYFVNDATGLDTNDGLTRGTAWKTINGNQTVLLGGDIVNIAPGTYVQPDANGLVLTSGGQFPLRVDYQKDTGAGSGNVVIDMAGVTPDTNGQTIGIAVQANGIQVSGFEVKNATWGVNVSGSDVEIASCTIHGMRPAKANASAHRYATSLGWCAGIVNAVASNAVNRNNLIYDIGYPELSNIAACIASPSSTNVKIYNNTLADAESGIATWNNADTAIEFKNNIVVGMRGYGIHPNYTSAEDNGEITHTNNFFFSNGEDYGWAGASPGAGEFNCNPKFATGGYTLDTGSPAINAGVDVGLAFQGPLPDLGAFETSSTAVAGALLQGTVTANVTGHPAITRATISAGGAVLGASDEQGKYAFPVAAGTYNLTALRGGFVAKSGSVTVAGGGTGTKDFDLDKGTSATWYVNGSTGNDSNNGQTPSTAWATIDRGDALGVINPGDTVMVAAGTYPQMASPGACLGVRFSKCFGEASAPITYKADGVVTIDQNSAKADDQTSLGFCFDADNIALGQKDADSGFDVTGCQYGAMVYSGRSGDTIANCTFHGIAEPEPNMGSYLSWAAGVYCDASVDTTIRNNVFFSVGNTESLATNPYTAGVTVNGGTGVKVYNNAMALVSKGAYLLNGATGAVRNNIISMFFGYGLMLDVPVASAAHSNNLFYPYDESAHNYGGLALPGPVEFTADPQFVALGADFHLDAGSPAINVGTNVGLPFIGPAPDLGAYETSSMSIPMQFCIVSGTVRYRSSGLPVEGATVGVVGLAASCVTGADGSYALVVDPGNWYVQVFKQGYASQQFDLNAVGGQSLTHDFYLSPGEGKLWSFTGDWSIGSNPNGQWSYGEAESVDSDAFLALPDAYDFGSLAPIYAGLQAWTDWIGDAPNAAADNGFPLVCCNPTDAQVSFFPPNCGGIHPGGGTPETGQLYGIARWTAPSTGVYEIYITLGAPWSTGETTDCHVTVNNYAVLNGILSGSGGTLSYGDRIPLNGGDRVDVFVGSNGAYYADWTPLAFTVLGVDDTPVNVTSIAAAKARGDGKLVAVTTAQIVTVGTGTFVDGSCYIEDAERTTGIKVVLDGPSSIAQGQKITFQGYMGTDDNGERFIRITSLTPQGTGSVKSLGMTNTAIGAGKTGLLVRVWGTVTETDPLGAFVILDDGSGSSIKVLKDASITKAMGLNKMVGVTGPVSLVANGPTMTTVVRARSNNDVVAYN